MYEGTIKAVTYPIGDDATKGTVIALIIEGRDYTKANNKRNHGHLIRAYSHFFQKGRSENQGLFQYFYCIAIKHKTFSLEV